ncbi:hypothetical protein AK830_g4798 [Neonectria ditissima]|uniref:Uncharacterized protein n=1 Tax=Neonectria ditissima TaxID=78410 RepID=A0A0P7AV16_9HYPO|nr:hypothetical protein AK830_g4798 [Neonectria ditissima]
MPSIEQGDFQRPTSSIRSPRFTEHFDAPFSEALMNASRTTIATDTMTYPSTFTNDRNSFGDESGRRPSFGTKQSGAQSPNPLRLRHSSWESETKRRSTINDRIREWARKSWGAVRNRSETRDGYFDANLNHSRSSAGLPPSPSDVFPNEPNGHASSQAHESRTELPASKSG